MSVKAPPLILHVIHHLFIGGMENGLVNLINRLPESRFRHVIVCIDHSSDFGQRITRRNVEVIPLKRSDRGIWAVRRDLYQLCRTLKPAIVHSRNLSGLDALLPARLAGVRHCIHGEHGRDVDDLHGENARLIWLRKLHMPLVNRYVTVSRDIEQYLIHKVGVKPDKVSQIYNGVDTVKFSPATHKPQGVLPDHFMGNEKIVICTVGRIQAVKDQQTLLRAFSGFLKKYPAYQSKVNLVIVGDGPLLKDLKQLAAALGVSDHVWFPGSLDSVAVILQASDIFVLPSLAEGVSNTILEAMATGLPVIATRVGGNVELVTDGLNGRLFSPGDVDGLMELLAGYIMKVDELKKHGQAARETALERFSLTAMISNYQKIYEDCVQH